MKSIIIASALLIFFLSFTVAGYVFLRLKGMGAVSMGTLIPEYKDPKKALLVIDIQRDLTEKGGKHVINPGQSDLMVSNTNKIIGQFDKSGDMIIYIRHHNKMDLLVKVLVNGALEKGSSGAAFDRRLKIIGKNIIEKKTGDAFSNPDLDSILQSNKVNQIYITGMVVEQCVDKTLKAAVNRNYRVVAVEDAMTSVSDKKRDEKIKDFAAMGAEVKATHDVLEQLSSQPYSKILP